MYSIVLRGTQVSSEQQICMKVIVMKWASSFKLQISLKEVKSRIYVLNKMFDNWASIYNMQHIQHALKACIET